jgi:hypothetical protein
LRTITLAADTTTRMFIMPAKGSAQTTTQ